MKREGTAHAETLSDHEVELLYQHCTGIFSSFVLKNIHDTVASVHATRMHRESNDTMILLHLVELLLECGLSKDHRLLQQLCDTLDNCVNVEDPDPFALTGLLECSRVPSRMNKSDLVSWLGGLQGSRGEFRLVVPHRASDETVATLWGLKLAALLNIVGGGQSEMIRRARNWIELSLEVSGDARQEAFYMELISRHNVGPVEERERQLRLKRVLLRQRPNGSWRGSFTDNAYIVAALCSLGQRHDMELRIPVLNAARVMFDLSSDVLRAPSGLVEMRLPSAHSVFSHACIRGIIAVLRLFHRGWNVACLDAIGNIRSEIVRDLLGIGSSSPRVLAPRERVGRAHSFEGLGSLQRSELSAEPMDMERSVAILMPVVGVHNERLFGALSRIRSIVRSEGLWTKTIASGRDEGSALGNKMFRFDACKNVICLLTSSGSSGKRSEIDPNVLIELGMAIGMRRRVIVLVDRRVEELPISLQGIAHVRVDLDSEDSDWLTTLRAWLSQVRAD